MKERRVVITGAGGISPLGTDWESVKAKILSQTNAVKVIDDWADIVVRRSRHRLWVKRGDALGNRGRRKPDSQTHHARDERQHLRANDVAYGTCEYRDLL